MGMAMGVPLLVLMCVGVARALTRPGSSRPDGLRHGGGLQKWGAAESVYPARYPAADEVAGCRKVSCGVAAAGVSAGGRRLAQRRHAGPAGRGRHRAAGPRTLK